MERSKTSHRRTGSRLEAAPRALADVARWNLRRLREAAELTQQTLAERAGMSPHGISYIETGHSDPTLESLARLAFGLDVDAQQLLAPLPSGAVVPRVRARTVRSSKKKIKQKK